MNEAHEQARYRRTDEATPGWDTDEGWDLRRELFRARAAEPPALREPGHGPPYDLAFIRECVARNPGGYTGEFRFLLSLVDAAEPPALDVERLERAYANAEATVRASRHNGQPFWAVFAYEYARLAREATS